MVVNKMYTRELHKEYLKSLNSKQASYQERFSLLLIPI